MSKKPDYRVAVAEEWTDQNSGEVKAYFTEVGSAWKTDKGHINVKLRDKISVGGNFMLFLKDADNGESRKSDTATQQGGGSGIEDEIPY